MKSLLKTILKILNLICPSKQDISFADMEIDIPIPYGSGEYDYRYRSESEAISAATNQVNSSMYSQRKNIISAIAANYKVSKCRKYYVDENVDGNYFYETRKALNKLLNEVASEIKLANPSAKIKDDLLEVNTHLKSSNAILDIFTKNWFDDNVASLVLAELTGSDYSFNYYCQYADTDDRDTYEYKTGLFGGSKEVEITRYCYYNLKEIYNDIAKDLKWACGFVVSEVNEYTHQSVTGVLNIFNADVKREISQKIKDLKSLI